MTPLSTAEVSRRVSVLAVAIVITVLCATFQPVLFFPWVIALAFGLDYLSPQKSTLEES